MCPADREAFSSFAHAQVAVTNQVYLHLGQPNTFLFCPTGQPRDGRTSALFLEWLIELFLWLVLDLILAWFLWSPSISS